LLKYETALETLVWQIGTFHRPDIGDNPWRIAENNLWS